MTAHAEADANTTHNATSVLFKRLKNPRFPAINYLFLFPDAFTVEKIQKSVKCVFIEFFCFFILTIFLAKKMTHLGLFLFMAEMEGFEPPIRLPVYVISSHAHSTSSATSPFSDLYYICFELKIKCFYIYSFCISKILFYNINHERLL